MQILKDEDIEAATSLADMIGAGAKSGDTFVITGFDSSRHVHTFDGLPVERPKSWIDGAEVTFKGWSDGVYVRRAQFIIDGEVWAGKGLASCLMVDVIKR